jgi:hypothetical protein
MVQGAYNFGKQLFGYAKGKAHGKAHGGSLSNSLCKSKPDLPRCKKQAEFNAKRKEQGHSRGGKRGPRPNQPSFGGNRHEVVKQVMDEKGLSMIEASKYVKAHNLY